jgi:hypothetical protein
MCSKEEVQAIADATEKRMEKKLQDSHMAVASTVSAFGKEIGDLRTLLKEHVTKEEGYQDRVEEHLKESAELFKTLAHLSVDDVIALKDIAQGYAGMGAVRKMILGMASVVLAIGAIVAGFIGIVKAIR